MDILVDRALRFIFFRNRPSFVVDVKAEEVKADSP